MKFLDPFMQRRRSTTNFSVSQSVSKSSSCYSGVQNIINTDSEVEKEGSEVLFDNQENHYDLDQSMDKQEHSMDETQALYENYINKKQLAKAPPVKKPNPLERNTQRLQESPLLNTKKNLGEIRRIRKLSKSEKDIRDGIVNKLGGCLNSFEKLIEKKQTNEDEDFVRSLSRDLSVFTPIVNIYLKKQMYEC
ncbi:hypothetical protein JTB14_010605 [Gonioctena quinquepunctata]|nr:hypothetical protein JTB14_010605 [Gonioctena quinquepunctata]